MQHVLVCPIGVLGAIPMHPSHVTATFIRACRLFYRLVVVVAGSIQVTAHEFLAHDRRCGMAIQIEWLRQIDRLIKKAAIVVDCKSIRASRSANTKYQSLLLVLAGKRQAIYNKDSPYSGHSGRLPEEVD